MASCTPAELRALARRDAWRGTTGGHCPGVQQTNVVILPTADAAFFAEFCVRNPAPCPLIEVLHPGDPEPKRSAPLADLRTDVPGYRVYRRGALAERRSEIRDLWRDDLVAFLLGCSFTFEHALVEAGVPLRHAARGGTVSMFRSNLPCVPVGRLAGPMVVTMRPIPAAQVELVRALSAEYPHAHGAPVHVGDPAAIGIADLTSPDYGDPTPLEPGDVPMFWACGVTPQVIAQRSGLELMITHEPGQMFVTDLPRRLVPPPLSYLPSPTTVSQ